jgi:membrane associated rhomboid family serine protease
METLAIEQKGSTKTTWLLVIACLIAYPVGIQNDYWACSYNSIFLEGRWWTVFTALFVHGSIGHLLGNMLFLFLFGRGLEKYVGSAGLFLMFIVGGAVSMFLSVLYYPPNELSVGASGAISAILATLMLFNPWRLSLLLNLFPMPLGVAAFTFLMLNFGGFLAARHNAETEGLHIAYLAHLIGFVVGMVLGMIISPNWKRNLMFSVIQFLCFYVILYVVVYYIRRT